MVALYCFFALLGVVSSVTVEVADDAYDLTVFAKRATIDDSTLHIDKSRGSKRSTLNELYADIIQATIEERSKAALTHDNVDEPHGVYIESLSIPRQKNRQRRTSYSTIQRRDSFDEPTGMTLNEQYAAMIQAALEEYEDALLDPENANEELQEEVRRFKEQFQIE